MSEKYIEGTVCRVDKAGAKLEKEDYDYVFIKKPSPFGYYKCYPCDIYGEILEFKPVYIQKDYLFLRTAFPHLIDEDLVTCVRVLTMLKILKEEKEIDLSIVEELSKEFATFTNKITLNVIAGRLL